MTISAIDKKIYSYSRNEQIVNAIIHGIGFILALAGTAVLVTCASFQGDACRIVSFSIYGASLAFMMLNSTLYHAITDIPKQRILRILDHISIFLLIAGTYTPFTLVTLRGPWGWSLFGAVWAIAVFGIVLKLFFTGRLERLSLFLYAFMGWLVIIAIKPLISALPTGGLWLIASGGVIYTAGIIFYAVDKIPYNHAIWHLFVLAGAICHFFAMYFYILPQ